MTAYLSLRTACLLCFGLIFTKSNAEDVEIFKNQGDSRRPIWNIAHMVNAMYQVDYNLDYGANSIEFDVSFSNEGYPQYTYHGIPCDCFRSCTKYEYFDTFIDYMKRLTTPGDSKFRKEFVLLFMDLKVRSLSERAQRFAGETIALKLLQKYWNYQGTSGGRAYVLISVPSIRNFPVIEMFERTLTMYNATKFLNKIGYDFSGNEDIDQILRMVSGNRMEKRIWQGDGITNCLSRGTSRLLKALNIRDQEPIPSQPKKVYWWTVDKYSTMRRTLKLGVDALITNYPYSLADVLKEEDIAKDVRLATYEDNPFKTHPIRLAKLQDTIQSRSGKLYEKNEEEEEEILYNS